MLGHQRQQLIVIGHSLIIVTQLVVSIGTKEESREVLGIQFQHATILVDSIIPLAQLQIDSSLS